MKIEELNLNPLLLKAVKGMGFTEPMPIQEKCIPEIRLGKDVVGQSSTGSGKTAAFGLPILEKIRPGVGLQVLILTPTRELCVQVTEALNEFGRYIHARAASVYGGVGIDPQIRAIRTADIVVGTPGRILDHLERRTIAFNNVKFLVLDEADRMFDMGFIDDVERIISRVPKERQTMLFSATFSSGIQDIVRRHMRSPVNVKGEIYVDKKLLKQVYYDIKVYEKFSLLVHLLKKSTSGLALIFCATRREVDVVAKNLKMQGVNAMAIHGGLTQNRRLYALDSLKKGHINVLVATDVAARGLDIKDISHVYNYDVPKSSEEYVHRIGRTARAGVGGDAVTLLSDRDYENFSSVLRDRTLEIRKAEPPHFEKVQFVRVQREFGGAERRDFGRSPQHGPRRYGQPSHGSSHGSYGGYRSESPQDSMNTSRGNRQDRSNERRPYRHSSGGGSHRSGGSQGRGRY
ncbi:DEAD/DEAH box helicase [Candidatus Woesearchaeota archaeon]|nr:DEAD/DEAH box helicase [Candidatus Woesearchaeota archaeon]